MNVSKHPLKTSEEDQFATTNFYMIQLFIILYQKQFWKKKSQY